MCYFKKPRLEEEDTPLPPSPESTQHSSSDSLAHSQVSPAACSPAPLLSPSQPAAGLPADLSAIDEPPSQPSYDSYVRIQCVTCVSNVCYVMHYVMLAYVYLPLCALCAVELMLPVLLM